MIVFRMFKTVGFFALLMTFIAGVITTVAAQSLETHISLEKATVMTGEPVVLLITVKNPKNAISNAYFPDNNLNWVNIAIIDAKGKAALPVPHYIHPASLNEFTLVSRPLEAGNTYAEQIVLNREWQLTEPGEYQIQVQLALPCYAITADGFDIVNGKAKPVSTFHVGKTLSLTMTQADNVQLRKFAERFFETLTKKDNWAAHDLARLELFSMPEAVALPVWKRLIDANENGLTLAELERMRTPASVELLGDIASNPKWSSDSRMLAKGSLWSMYSLRKQFASRALEAALAKTLLRVNGTLPEDR